MIATSAVAWACNIPVFRYALERWKPDLCEVIVFHSGDLSPQDSKTLEPLLEAARKDNAGANLEVLRVTIEQQECKDPRFKDLWLNIKDKTKAQLPYIVIRTAVSDKPPVNAWHGPIGDFQVKQVLDSPARRELIKRLLKGDSVVWILVRSSKEDRNKAVRKMLDEELPKLSKNTPFPEGLGLPGSELYSELPLLMQFSVLEIDSNDAEEVFLLNLLKGFQPQAVAEGEPLLVPVFGRGRALEVIPANQCEPGLVGDLTRYLAGACSCQVKERNPGFDLLLSARWDRELFGEDGVLPPPPKEFDPDQAPTLLTIPPGK